MSYPVPGPGRPKGSKNKVSIFDHHFLQSEFERLSFQPLEEAIKLYRHPDTENHDKALIIKDLLQYCYPKRRTVEVSGDVNHTALNITWDTATPKELTVDAELKDG